MFFSSSGRLYGILSYLGEKSSKKTDLWTVILFWERRFWLSPIALFGFEFIFFYKHCVQAAFLHMRTFYVFSVDHYCSYDNVQTQRSGTDYLCCRCLLT